MDLTGQQVAGQRKQQLALEVGEARKMKAADLTDVGVR